MTKIARRHGKAGCDSPMLPYSEEIAARRPPSPDIQAFNTPYTAHTRITVARTDRFKFYLTGAHKKDYAIYLPPLFPLLETVTAETSEELRDSAQKTLVGKSVLLIRDIENGGTHTVRMKVSACRINERYDPALGQKICPGNDMIARQLVLPELVLVDEDGNARVVTADMRIFY